MYALKPTAIATLLGLLLSGAAFADPYQAPSSHQPIYISQTLPPIQGGSGYSTPGYNTYTQPNNQYNNQYTPTNPYSAPQYAPNYNQSALQGYVATAPAGSVMSTTISSPISSEFARVGDRFDVTLSSPLAAGNSILLPAGSKAEGQVVMVKPAGRTGRNGELEIRFNTAVLPSGQRIPLSAKIQTEDGTGILKGGSGAGRAGRAALSTGAGAGLGAALGTAMGPLSGGGVGRGAIYGTALGAGMGMLGAAMQKGKPAVIDTSQPVNIVLDQPLATSPMQDSGYQQQAQPYPYNSQPNSQPYNY